MMTFNWYQIEGEDLAGRYRLKQCLTSSADDAWYLTRFDGADAAIRVMLADASSRDQLEIWREILSLRHPHLLSALDAGRTKCEGTGLIYLVTEYPDDFLAAAVAQRVLSESEAGEVLSACQAALAYLHGKGLVHGAVDPAHIVSIGDRIKLASDTIRPAGADLTQAADRLALGATVVEVLTGRRPEPGAAVTGIPEQFAKLVQQAYGEDSEQQTAKELKAETQASAAPPPPAAPPVTMPAATEPTPAAKESEPAAAALPPLPSIAPAAKLNLPAKRGLPLKWVPVVGLLAALLLTLVLRRNPAPPAPPPVAAADRTTAEPPAVVPTRLPAASPVVNPAPTAAPPASKTERADPYDNWRVVVYEYANRPAAEKEARLLNAKHPAWHVEIFTPQTNRRVYLVAIGGWMTRNEAERVRKEALAKGLPRDTFIRNFRE